MANTNISPDGRVGLAHETFNLVLDKVLQYVSGPKSLTNKFSYHWDFAKNMGLGPACDC